MNVRPLAPDIWPALDDLFSVESAVGRCWCMYWRIGAEYRKRPPEQNRRDFLRVVQEGPPPGLVAFEGETAVGWCQLTPRSDLPRLERSKVLKPVDDLPVWAISCFYIRKGYRRQGVSTALIEAALDRAREAGAAAVEAYPLDAALTPSSSHTGYASTFERLGFVEVARHVDSRPIMRYVFEDAASTPTQL